MGFFDRSKKVKKTQPTPPAAIPQPPTRPQPQPHQQPQPTWQGGSLSSSSQPIGFLPPPSGWQPGSSPPPPYPYPQHDRPYGSIVVNQHYYLGPPPALPSSVALKQKASHGALGKLHLGSMVDLATNVMPAQIQRFDDGLSSWHRHGTQLLNQGAAVVDQISSQLNDVLTHIDGGRYVGNERDLFSWQAPVQSHPNQQQVAITTDRALGKKSKKETATKGQAKPSHHNQGVTSSVVSGTYFAKVDLYGNSKLPMNLEPLRLYIPTYPLLCLAAQYAERVYDRPQGAERDAHVDADWKTGTKAMVLKSVPMDHMNTIVFAIRGSATFMDWAVNLNMAPASPTGFLDDPGNFCHAGFLSVARRMIRPVAQRLRQLLEEMPSRARYSLLITGHSAGGAVASLLYSHMLARSGQAQSELTSLASCFKRIHCVTFGTPPVSLLPLVKPDRPELKKSLFLSFVNEGDPVVRADKAYVKSLLELFASPAPKSVKDKSSSSLALPASSGKAPKKEKSKSSLVSAKSSKSATKSSKTGSTSSKSGRDKPVWKVPASTLSNAGRIVVLRSGDPRAKLRDRKTVEERLNEGVVAHVASDELLRGVIWGDPVCHVMRLYAGRIETLAVGAVTATGRH